MTNYTLVHNDSAVTPVYHWRGARPFPLDLGEADVGATALLLLAREGDVCLLPLTWECNVPDDGPRGRPFVADALDREALRLTLADLEGDGWRVAGRLDVRFTGQFAADDFWERTLGPLWQTPGDSHGA